MSAYRRIAQIIAEQDPLTAPKDDKGNIHEAFLKHLTLIYSPEEAEIVQYLNVVPGFKPARDVAASSGKALTYVEKILADLVARGAVLGMGDHHCLPPVPSIINYHHVYPEVKPGDIEAAKLYDEYFIKGGFSRYYESSEKGTSVARAIPIGEAIQADEKVLPAEEVHDYILNHSSEDLALVPCPCRTRTEKLDIRGCKDKFPIGACLMMGATARDFDKIGLGKSVTQQQAIEYIDGMHKLGLVLTTTNTSYGDMVICSCCGCCCSMTRGRIKWDNPDAVAPSNFIPKPGDDCIGCGECTQKCPFEALSMDEDTDKPSVEIDKCIGCGVCTLACPVETLKLHRHERSKLYETTKDMFKTIFRENREK